MQAPQLLAPAGQRHIDPSRAEAPLDPARARAFVQAMG